MGNPVNVGARLMENAVPGQILVSQAAAELAQDRIRFRALKSIHIKGQNSPISVTEAIQPKISRIHISKPTEYPIVGRETELKQLCKLLTEVESGKSQIVTIEPEAGLGKSQLVSAWAKHAHQRNVPLFWGTSQSTEQNIPYRVWQDILSSFLKFDHSMPTIARHTQIENYILSLAPHSVVYMPLLNDMLDHVDIIENNITTGLTAQERQQALITFILSLFQAVATQTPLLLVFDDVHWMDAISWELVLQVVRSLQVTNSPHLFVFITRPMEKKPNVVTWLQQLDHHTHINLHSLTPTDIETLISNHLGIPPSGLPSDLRNLIQNRAEGNPLLATELLLNLQTQHIVTVYTHANSGKKYCLIDPAFEQVATSLPDSLQGLILSRIDRLPTPQQLILKLACDWARIYTPFIETPIPTLSTISNCFLGK